MLRGCGLCFFCSEGGAGSAQRNNQPQMKISWLIFFTSTQQSNRMPVSYDLIVVLSFVALGLLHATSNRKRGDEHPKVFCLIVVFSI
jgi:hypothetical protein